MEERNEYSASLKVALDATFFADLTGRNNSSKFKSDTHVIFHGIKEIQYSTRNHIQTMTPLEPKQAQVLSSLVAS